MDRKTEEESQKTGPAITPPEAEMTVSSKKVSQTEFAKGLRQAILTAALREGFRAMIKAMMSAAGIDFEQDHETITLPEIDELFDGIEVSEPMENEDRE